jgi:hypothetical protein
MLLLVGCIHKTMTHTHLVIALLKSSGLTSQDVVKLVVIQKQFIRIMIYKLTKEFMTKKHVAHTILLCKGTF